MIIVKHRVNSVNSLRKTPPHYGVEIDLRTYGTQIVVDHEPYRKSITFNKWIQSYQHRLLILNIKEERIEFDVLKIIKKNKIRNYFFLDSTIPMVHIMNKKKIYEIALRISNYENYLNYFNLTKLGIKNKWLWLDTIDGNIPVQLKDLKKLKKIGYKICLVSQELPLKKISNLDRFEKKFSKYFSYIDAVCTKKLKFWGKYEN